MAERIGGCLRKPERGFLDCIAVVVLLAVVLWALCSSPPAAAAAEVLNVSPAGNDSGDGSQAAPLRTIGRALKLAEAGATISVAAGEYPPFETNRRFGQPVRIVGAGQGATVVQADTELQSEGAIEFWGAGGVTIEQLTVRGGRVYITDERNHELHQGSTDIVLREDEMVGEEGLGAAATIRSGSERITVEGCYLHDLRLGLTGPNYRIINGVDNGLPLVDGVTIRNNRIEHLKEDAIQFADWDDVAIEGNILRDAEHDPAPAPQYHNDLIQFTGYSSHVRILDNHMTESAQEIFIQPAFGPIDDVLVENNLLWDSRAYAVQSQAATGLVFVNNTVWSSQYGMTIREGPHGEPPATDGVVVNNVIEKLGYPAGTREEYNLVGTPQRAAGYGAHDLLGADPHFAAVADGDLHLEAGSPAIGAGSAADAPLTDLDGITREVPPSLGAFEHVQVNPGEEAPESPEEEPAPEGKPGPPSDSPHSPPPGNAAEVGASSPSQPPSAVDPGGEEIQLKLRLRFQRKLVATTEVSAPNFCSADCRVVVDGTLLLPVAGGRRPVAVKRHRASLRQLLRQGIRLVPRRRADVEVAARPGVTAQLTLRFLTAGKQVRLPLRVRFGAG